MTCMAFMVVTVVDNIIFDKPNKPVGFYKLIIPPYNHIAVPFKPVFKFFL